MKCDGWQGLWRIEEYLSLVWNYIVKFDIYIYIWCKFLLQLWDWEQITKINHISYECWGNSGFVTSPCSCRIGGRGAYAFTWDCVDNCGFAGLFIRGFGLANFGLFLVNILLRLYRLEILRILSERFGIYGIMVGRTEYLANVLVVATWWWFPLFLPCL